MNKEDTALILARIEQLKLTAQLRISEFELTINKLEGTIKEQQRTIESLNWAIGGKGSTTTENLRLCPDEPLLTFYLKTMRKK